MSPTPQTDALTLRLRSRGAEFSVCARVKNSQRARNFKMWISGEAEVSVTKPNFAPKSEAVAFVEKNADWVFDRLSEYSRPQTLSEFLLKNPRLSAGGAEWAASLSESQSLDYFIDDESAMRVRLASRAGSEESLKNLILKFGAPRMSAELERISAETGLPYSRVSFRSQSSRWASRSATGTLSFNWRIFLLPADLHGYVLRHEMAHAKFMDHSAAFWIYLNRICPGAKRLDARLGKFGAEIFKVGRDSEK